jgi:hypothetical protein
MLALACHNTEDFVIGTIAQLFEHRIKTENVLHTATDIRLSFI